MGFQGRPNGNHGAQTSSLETVEHGTLGLALQLPGQDVDRGVRLRKDAVDLLGAFKHTVGLLCQIGQEADRLPVSINLLEPVTPS